MQSTKSPADKSSTSERKIMRRAIRVSLLLIVLLAGCAGPSRFPPGFVNQTQHSDAELWSLWKTAQQNLAQQIDLNPLEQKEANATPDIRPGDARAWSITPHQVLVSAQADVSSSALLGAGGTRRVDPTGLILCPAPCSVKYAPAYSLYSQPATRYAKSWEFSGNNFDALVEYEFENQILSALGYDLSWR